VAQSTAVEACSNNNATFSDFELHSASRLIVKDLNRYCKDTWLMGEGPLFTFSESLGSRSSRPTSTCLPISEVQASNRSRLQLDFGYQHTSILCRSTGSIPATSLTAQAITSIDIPTHEIDRQLPITNILLRRRRNTPTSVTPMLLQLGGREQVSRLAAGSLPIRVVVLQYPVDR